MRIVIVKQYAAKARYPASAQGVVQILLWRQLGARALGSVIIRCGDESEAVAGCWADSEMTVRLTYHTRYVADEARSKLTVGGYDAAARLFRWDIISHECW